MLPWWHSIVIFAVAVALGTVSGQVFILVWEKFFQ